MIPHIAPSILSADFYNLKPQLESLKPAGVTVIHVDVMDGLFVNNISIGIPVVAALKGHGSEQDVHLMIERPERYVRQFIEAGADWLTVHLEAVQDGQMTGLLELIRRHGGKPGIAVRPDTDMDAAAPYLHLCDQLLVMTVQPGFGGQPYDPNGDSRISYARDLIKRHNPSCLLAADGGLDAKTIPGAVRAGVQRVVAGSAVFNGGDPGKAAARLLDAALGRK